MAVGLVALSDAIMVVEKVESSVGALVANLALLVENVVSLFH